MTEMINLDKYILTMYKVLHMQLKATGGMKAMEIQREIDNVDAFLAAQGLKIEDNRIIPIPDEPEEIEYEEPLKFKEGDWIIFTDTCGREILQVTFAKYNTYEFSDGTNTSRNDERFMKLWTIDDAEPGDIIMDEWGNIEIYKKAGKFGWYSSGCLGYDGKFYAEEIKHPMHITEQDSNRPATEEEQEKFWKAAEEACYKYDKEKHLFAKDVEQVISKHYGVDINELLNGYESEMPYYYPGEYSKFINEIKDPEIRSEAIKCINTHIFNAYRDGVIDALYKLSKK